MMCAPRSIPRVIKARAPKSDAGKALAVKDDTTQGSRPARIIATTTPTPENGGVSKSVFESATGLSTQAAEVALARLLAEGFVLMPVQPTREMLDAGEDAIRDCEDSTRDTEGTYSWVDFASAAVKGYRAMLGAVWPNIVRADEYETNETT